MREIIYLSLADMYVENDNPILGYVRANANVKRASLKEALRAKDSNT